MFSTLAITRSSASSSRIGCVSFRTINTLSNTPSPKATRLGRFRRKAIPPIKSSLPSSSPISSTEVLPGFIPKSTQDPSKRQTKGQDEDFTFLNKFFQEAAQTHEDRALNAFKHRPYLFVRPTGSLTQSSKSDINPKPGQLLVDFPVAPGRTPYIKIVTNGPLTREYIDHTFTELAIRVKSICLLSQQAPDETFDLGRFVFQVELSSVMNLVAAVGVHWPHFEILSAHLAEEHIGLTTRRRYKPLDVDRNRDINSSTNGLFPRDRFEFERIPAATRLPVTDPIKTLPTGSYGFHIKIISNRHLDYTYLQALFGKADPSITIYTMWNLPSVEPSALCLKRRYFCMVQLGSMDDLHRALKLDLPSCKIISIHFDQNNIP